MMVETSVTEGDLKPLHVMRRWELGGQSRRENAVENLSSRKEAKRVIVQWIRMLRGRVNAACAR